jgi:hypothetical protein
MYYYTFPWHSILITIQLTYYSRIHKGPRYKRKINRVILGTLLIVKTLGLIVIYLDPQVATL